MAHNHILLNNGDSEFVIAIQYFPVSNSSERAKSG